MRPSRLRLWMGRIIPTPVSAAIAGAVDRVEVAQKSRGRSVFQVSFLIQRGRVPANDYALLAGPFSPLSPTTRVIVAVELNGVTHVLIDGFVLHQQLAPGGGRDGQALITLTGEDVSVKMDLDERYFEYPALTPNMIAGVILLKYPELGLLPLVIPPLPPISPLNPLEYVPLQQATDYAFVTELAAQIGYVFRVQPGPAPLINVAYWGPDIRIGLVPQPALTVGQPNATNVDGMNFSYDAMQLYTMRGEVLDDTFNKEVPLWTVPSPIDPYATLPPALIQAPNFWRSKLRDFVIGGETARAYAIAQLQTMMSQQTVVKAEGSLDPFRYGRLLKAFEPVAVRGAGRTYDGVYFVQDVTTMIERGRMKQRFVLTRGGLGSTLDRVPVGS
jgi:hypothetical protein